MVDFAPQGDYHQHTFLLALHCEWLELVVRERLKYASTKKGGVDDEPGLNLDEA